MWEVWHLVLDPEHVHQHAELVRVDEILPWQWAAVSAVLQGGVDRALCSFEYRKISGFMHGVRRVRSV